MRQFLSKLAAALLLGLASGSAAHADAATYDGLLARYVSRGADGVNRVDYARWKAAATDKAALDGFIAEQEKARPSAMTTAQKFAYWANLYNAVTLKVVLDRYPVASIRDIKSDGVWLDPKAFTGPWVAKRVTVEGRELSLDEIEHTILRPTFKDPRVHYSVNCASIGCPNLRPVAWRAETLDADLDEAARDFINHPRGVAVDGKGGLMVSSIYTWFKADFGGTDAGVIAHLAKFAGPALAKQLGPVKAIGADQYDWSINDTSGSTSGTKAARQ